MLNLKKTAVAVLAFGSSVAFAGTMGPVCQPGNVTVPCENQAWDLGMTALYLKPSASGAAGNYLGQTHNTAGSVVNLHDADPDWGWGFMLEGSYHFSTGNDVTVNWYHLDDNSTSARYGAGFTHFADNINKFGSTTAVTVSPRWDAVNFEFGQHVDLGQFKNVRFHGGLQYARIETKASVLSTSALAADTNFSYAQTAKFNGVGPRVGSDFSYDFGNGMAVYAKAAAALLAGTSKFNSVNNNFATGAAPASVSVNGSRTAIVPELEAKLGATYTYAMAQGDLSLDAGWMFANYFNAQTTSAYDDSDFGVQGPYIGLKWVGSVV
jgi:hypothetical protein